jgi:pilus assembly protein Flp/PilA
MTSKLITSLKKFANDDSGPTAVEYALMVSLIAVVIIAAVTYIGTQTRTTFNTVGAAVGP